VLGTPGVEPESGHRLIIRVVVGIDVVGIIVGVFLVVGLVLEVVPAIDAVRNLEMEIPRRVIVFCAFLSPFKSALKSMEQKEQVRTSLSLRASYAFCTTLNRFAAPSCLVVEVLVRMRLYHLF
jgi:hypothetical protein